MSFWSWLTGHSDKESDVYANFDKVGTVIEELNSISVTSVAAAQENINAALEKLNNVNGLADYVGTIQVGSYDPMFQSIADSIKNIGSNINKKAEDIKIYNESSIFEKLGSSVCMGLFKTGEGLLSVGEDLVDGAASVVGWAAGALKDKSLQEGIAKFIEKDHAHDLFNFYYNSDFAKKSFFTEDSALAGGFKLVGKTVGYLYAGGTLAGLGSGLGIGKSAIGTFAKGIASSTTWGATVAGLVGGLGNGVESGLQRDMSYNKAMSVGLASGAIQGGLAFAGGKLGEHLAKSATIKNAPNKAAADAARSAKASTFEGYSDTFTKAGQQFGLAQGKTIQTGFEAVSASVKSATSGIRHLNPVQANSAQMAASSARTAFRSEAANLIKNANPIVQSVNGMKSAVSSLGARVVGTAKVVKNASVKGAASKISGGVSALPGAVKSSAKAVLNSISPAAPGVIAVAGESLINNAYSNAGLRFNNSNNITQDVASGKINLYTDNARANLVDPDTIEGGVKIPDGMTPSLKDPVTGNDIGKYDVVTDSSTPKVEQPTTPVQGLVTNSTPYTNTTPVSPGGGSVGGGYTPYSPITTPGIGTTPTNITTPTLTVPTYVSYTPSSIVPTGGGGYTPSSIVSGGDSDFWPTPTYMEYQPLHSGGSLSDGKFSADDGKTSNELLNAENLLELDEFDDNEENLLSEGSALDDIINGSKYTKVPTATIPTNTQSKKKSSVIPIAAGLTVAAAAGLGAKAYLDHKNNNDVDDEEEYDEEFDSDDWYDEETGDDENTVDVEYNEELEKDDSDQEYYQDYESTYSAKNHDELADLE